jgi:hypothetical protein
VLETASGVEYICIARVVCEWKNVVFYFTSYRLFFKIKHCSTTISLPLTAKVLPVKLTQRVKCQELKVDFWLKNNEYSESGQTAW